MLLLASGTALIGRYGDEPWFGQFIDPRSRNRVTVPRRAADNAAFTDFNARAYLAMLERMKAIETPPIFVAVPDVVGDAFRTRWRFCDWYHVLKPYGFPLAYVLQDGERAETVPWAHIAAVFIGGTTAFKIGAQARALAAEAKRRGLWVHMGRLSGHKRFMYAQQLGIVDSVDGSGFARFADAMLPRFTRVALHPTLDFHGS